MTQFTQISFQNEFADQGREGYEIIHDRDSVKWPHNQYSLTEEIATIVENDEFKMTTGGNAFTNLPVQASIGDQIVYNPTVVTNMPTGYTAGEQTMQNSIIILGSENSTDNNSSIQGKGESENDSDQGSSTSNGNASAGTGDTEEEEEK
ncbi:MAG: hypothetical protein CVU43_18580 [Chloroflexi bacterium HGW-Chloroflexi-5]|jgi:hypothetical protein|nr:MAG: hypothetical protein CVU43_18580 [Chloroflexi bacterium HGW-Chloroflexi-5]